MQLYLISSSSVFVQNLLTKGAFEREAMELKKKIKATIGDAFKCDEEIGDLRHHQEDLGIQLEEKQKILEELSGMANGKRMKRLSSSSS